MLASFFNRLSPHWVFKLPPHKKQIALTFDDGPDERTTQKILASLRQLNIRATFFVVGEKCSEHIHILRQIQEENHLLANHGFVHRHHFNFSTEQQQESILKTHQCLQSQMLSAAPFFRPPYGSFNWKTSAILKQNGYRGVLWSVMIGDWKKQDKEFLWRKLKRRMHDGAIIVLHDSVSALENVLFILPRLAEEAERRDLKFVRLDEELDDLKTIQSFIAQPS